MALPGDPATQTIFIYSKIPELLDTIFMVLRNKKVIFLHWFHHATVLLYCWHAFHTSIASGIWFASMNYCVHSIMYMYFFLAAAGYYKVSRRALANIRSLCLSPCPLPPLNYGRM